MDLHEIVCQVRADLRIDIPEAIRASTEVRRHLAELFGFPPPVNDVPRAELMRLLQRGEPTDLRVSDGGSPDADIDLEGGLFRVGNDEVLIVENLQVTRTSIYVRARASTAECTSIVKETAGILQHYGAPALDKLKPTYEYASGTSTTLSFPIEKLLSPEMMNFLNDALVPAAQAGRDDLGVEIHPYTLAFKVHVLPRAGSAAGLVEARKRMDFRIGHRRVPDHDEQLYEVYSEYASDVHLEMLKRLEQIITGSGEA